MVYKEEKMEIFLAIFMMTMVGTLIAVLWWENKNLRKKYNEILKEYAEEVARWRQ